MVELETHFHEIHKGKREEVNVMVSSYLKRYGSAFDNDDAMDAPVHGDDDQDHASTRTKKIKLEQHAVLNVTDAEMTVCSSWCILIGSDSSLNVDSSQMCSFMHLKMPLWLQTAIIN